MDTIITLGRQFGSGGREIGKKLAQALGVPYYDKELLAVAAKESGLSAQFLHSYDEKPTNSFLYSLVMGQQNLISPQGQTVEQLASSAQREAVRSVAEKGACVIVGRGADYILRDRKDLVRVFISADWDYRVDHVCRRDAMTAKEAEVKLRKMDKERASYYNFATDRNWGEAANYDLCVNVTQKGPEGAVATILAYLKA